MFIHNKTMFFRYVAAAIIPRRIHAPRGVVEEVKVTCGYVQATVYPVT